MKGVFSLIALLLSLAVVGFLIKKQIASTQQIVPSLQAPATDGAQTAASAPGQSPRQIEQQFKQALQDAMQQPRTVPEEK
ncbi:MAG: hypothetical protein WCN21_06645 [Comamonadaceae bacterium]